MHLPPNRGSNTEGSRPAQALLKGSQIKSMGLSTIGLINDGEARLGVCVPHGLGHRTREAPAGFALTLGHMLLWLSPWGKRPGFPSWYFSLKAKAAVFFCCC